jgi:phosphorylcholine metabolism protein LicD
MKNSHKLSIVTVIIIIILIKYIHKCVNSYEYKFKKCLVDMKKLLDSHSQEFFLIFGTLLGCIRTGKFITYDVDVDIGIFSDKFDPNIIEKISNSKKFTFLKKFGEIKDSFEISYVHNNGTRIDINLFYKIKNNDYYCTSFYGLCDDKKEKYCKWGFTIDGLRKKRFYGTTYMIPSDPRNFLATQYGSDWETPKKINYFEGLDIYPNLIN